MSAEIVKIEKVDNTVIMLGRYTGVSGSCFYRCTVRDADGYKKDSDIVKNLHEGISLFQGTVKDLQNHVLPDWM